ncbi:hypothetical protein OOT00_14495 [Desulfobotulus sp. H1]|uniref:Uncharacterized protein n=1 Tax=Desulfobotulus pelophilus TaxID=2823377 RepID=A0ABT3NCL4_9BACT|nr:hypothetical protein [Desulfobotulus pelophilus]MCW7755194.1 hypothetical protein [Desulfobotulus pelophilus]
MKSEDKQATGWFQFPSFDVSPFLSPNMTFTAVQDWLKDQKVLDASSIWPGSALFPDLSKAGMEWYSLASEQMQTALGEYWKLMGLVPANEYERLLEQYKAVKHKLEEEQKKNKKGEQDSSSLKQTEEALKSAESQIKKLEEDLKKALQTAEKKETQKTSTAKTG